MLKLIKAYFKKRRDDNYYNAMKNSIIRNIIDGTNIFQIPVDFNDRLNNELSLIKTYYFKEEGFKNLKILLVLKDKEHKQFNIIDFYYGKEYNKDYILIYKRKYSSKIFNTIQIPKTYLISKKQLLQIDFDRKMDEVIDD